MAGFLLPGSDYLVWANCGIGSFVEIENTTDMTIEGISFKGVSTGRMTLVGIDSERAVVEIVMQSNPVGQDSERHRFEIPARPKPVPEPPRQRKPNWEENAEVVFFQHYKEIFKNAPWKEGEETLLIAGQPILCRWKENAGTLVGEAIHVKEWLSNQIPGGMAGIESSYGSKQLTKMTVTSFEKK